VKADQARSFAAALRATSSRPVVYAELPHAQHGFDLVASPRARQTIDAIERFLGVTYGDWRAQRAASRSSANASSMQSP